MSALTSSAEQFAEYIASHTGLDLYVVRAWVGHESAWGTSPAGNFNYLNMRNPAGGWQSFSSWQTGAQAVVRQLQTAPNWYGGILKSASQPAAQQIAAIANSPWDAGHYGGGGGVNLVRTYNGLVQKDVQPYAVGAVNPKGGSSVSGTSTTTSSKATEPDAYNYGEFGAYLSIPELKPILVRAAQEHWDTTKLQMAIFSTTWWKTHVEKQRTWNLQSPADQQRAIQQESVRLMQTLEQDVLGSGYMQRHGITITSAVLKKWATQIASGQVDESVFLYNMTLLGRKRAGTPAYQSLLDQQRQAGAAGTAIEDLRGQLEDKWREWLGNAAPMPNLQKWAENIYKNVNSEQDYLIFLKTQAKSLYPNMPDNVPFQQYAGPAKGILQQTLELGDVKDNDPLLSSYVQGQIPSLADLKDRAMRDPRLANASWWQKQQQQTGFQLAQKMGVA